MIFTLNGYVSDVGEQVAQVALTDKEGNTSFAEIDTSELMPLGLTAGDSFDCEFTTPPDGDGLHIIPKPKRVLTNADWERIDLKLKKAIPDSCFADGLQL